MARALTWKQLTVGLVGLLVVVASAAAVLLFAHVGGVRGEKATLYVTAAGARGVLKGTHVMIAGKRAGTVNEISFLPPETDTLSRLLIEVDVLRDALPLLRRDSYAYIRPSGTIIGAPVIDISTGTTTARPVSEGDTIPALPQLGGRVADRVQVLGEELGGALQDWRSTMTNVRSASGTFGAARARGPEDVAEFRAGARALMNRLTRGRGTIALAVRDAELRSRVSSAVAAADSIGTLLGSDSGTLGRLRRDESLVQAMEATRAELADVARSLREARGTAGRAQQDRALENEIATLRDRLGVLIEDVKSNPFRYIAF